jgi:hypothetical protein
MFQMRKSLLVPVICTAMMHRDNCQRWELQFFVVYQDDNHPAETLRQHEITAFAKHFQKHGLPTTPEQIHVLTCEGGSCNLACKNLHS